ncbi:DUF4174 domain-containing protein [Oceaniglobus indicus]|uniref:DUF4174 domain-containing protein n=1 Tax=Oceaniglobus indicus TaxID=2047749 RepID=UPI000C188C4F|nr:DUF4174 domain-containing protein [Oceaniglobus indicus]
MRTPSRPVTGNILAVLTVALLAVPGAAQQTVIPIAEEQAVANTPLERWRDDPTIILDGAEVDLEDFRWVARPVIVFANSPEDPAFRDQMNLLLARPDALANRDVVLITDTDPSDPSAVRRKLRPRAFMLALIGKDGQIKLRKPLPWDVRELTRSIDKMPMRQREMNERPLGD